MAEYIHIWCYCGHHATVALSRNIGRDETLHRARCTACGRRRAKDLIAVTDAPLTGIGWQERNAELHALPVIEV